MTAAARAFDGLSKRNVGAIWFGSSAMRTQPGREERGSEIALGMVPSIP